jgi:hypothetical protein
MRMRIIAVKNIQAGEEITISYITPGYTKAERTTGIQISWGFYCNCPLCSASEATTNESDARIIKIKLLQQELGNWDDTNIVAGQAELLIQLAVQEGMVPITGQYLLAAFTYSSLGLLDKSLEFARKAVTSGSKFEGEDDSLFIKAKEFVDNPTEHWSWKLRVVEEAENGTTQNED